MVGTDGGRAIDTASYFTAGIVYPARTRKTGPSKLRRHDHEDIRQDDLEAEAGRREESVLLNNGRTT